MGTGGFGEMGQLSACQRTSANCSKLGPLYMGWLLCWQAEGVWGRGLGVGGSLWLLAQPEISFIG